MFQRIGFVRGRFFPQRLHRFVWDLCYPPPEGVDHEYPISAIFHNTPRYPLGALVVPGEYSLKLTVDGKSYTQP